MKVAVIGSNGQLGSDLVKEFTRIGADVNSLTHNDIKVEVIDSVHSTLEKIKPDVILNTSAFHVVPKCEEEPVQAYQVNALGALNLSKISEELKAVNLYFSTDYVFDGKKLAPYVEADCPNPLNIYASTKLLGEYYTLNYSPKGIVVRISGIYGKVPCRAKGGNFITTMIKAAKEKPEVKVVNDEILTPTPTKEIAKKTLDIIRSENYNLFHLTCEGQCSWYEFARAIFGTLKLATPLNPFSVQDMPMVVKRPTYSVLENKRIKDIGISDMPYWKDALLSFLNENYKT
jgi:dTDP-4-dehydrorhamnose reductase